jgi:hypothetical protein
MAKTRRRASYKKSKRWNPKSRKSARGRKSRRRNCGRNPYSRRDENNIETVKYIRKGGRSRNPAVFRKMLWDGSEVSVSTDGHVRIVDGGSLYDSYRIPTWRVGHFISSIKGARRGNREHFRADNMMEEVPELQHNPKRRGTKRGHRGSKNKRRGRALNHEMRYQKGSAAKAWRKGRKSKARARRRNPAQFPMPFTSAMNPRRKRNHPISRRDAASMKRVLRSHKYRCR